MPVTITARVLDVSYCTTAACYLERALPLLETGGQAELYYAAFELSSGVAARQREYADANQGSYRRARSQWKLVRLLPELRPALRTEEATRVQVELPAWQKSVTLIHAPVTTRLRQCAKLLSQRLVMPPTSPTRAMMLELREVAWAALHELKTASSGNLVGPPDLRWSADSLYMAVQVDEGNYGALTACAEGRQRYRVTFERYGGPPPRKLP